ncbi:Apoptosis-inducing factor 1, mitochondrial [Globomyces sp. JEL0801]|nr:Apoptosis-inducing factor 1, mitochondrial [Globomyces sp. JEL0801]
MNSIRRILKQKPMLRNARLHTERKKSGSPVTALVLVGTLLALGPAYSLWSKYEDKPVKKPSPITTVSVPKSVTGPDVDYILIGGGTASFSAMQAIREVNPTAKVLIISEEEFFPYQRPPLSKELWNSSANLTDLTFVDWQNKKSSIFYAPSNYFNVIDPKNDIVAQLTKNTTKVNYLPKTSVLRLDTDSKSVILNNATITYSKVLIATGGTPKKLQVAEKLSEQMRKKVTTFRNVDDFKALDKVTDKAKTVVVIGGGFLGSELSSALAKKSKIKVIQVFPEEGNLSNVFPKYLTAWTTSKLEKEGVIVKPKCSVTDVSEKDSRIELKLNNGETVTADHVVVAMGLSPNVAIAHKSGIEVDPVLGGILVNAELEARSDVYAAGDVSSYHDIALGRRRVEHYDHAVNSGRVAGLNMAGVKKPYTHQSMYWSSIGSNVNFEAIGLTDPKLKTISVWSQPTSQNPDKHHKGAVYYMRDAKVVGVLLWNLHDKLQLELARNLIADAKTINDPNSLASAINVHQ